jgi:HSP20 family protein
MPKHQEWDPLKELNAVKRRMNQLFERALARTDFNADGEVGSWEPLADIFETKERFHVCLELPGLGQDEIEVRVDGDELIVEGERLMDREQAGGQFHRVERSYGKFVRRFRLPSTVDRESVRAAYRNGVLDVRLERTDRSEPRAIRVSIR